MLDAIIALITIFYIIYQYGTWNKNYWKIRNVPSTEPLPFIGDLKNALLTKEHFGVIYSNIYNKFKGCRYVGLYELRTPVLMIRDPQLVKDILQKDFNSFASNGININEDVDKMLSNNTFFKTGEEWKQTRSHVSQHMTPVKLKTMVPAIDGVATNMMKYLNERSTSIPEDIEVKDLLSRYTTDVIATAIMSLKSNSFLETPSLFYKVTHSIFDEDRGVWNGLQQFIFFTLPGLAKLIGARFQVYWDQRFQTPLRFFLARFTPAKIEQTVLKVTVDVMEQRIKSGEVRNDFFQTVIAMREKDPKTFTDFYIASQLFGFLLDGFETSSAAMSFALFEIANNLEVQGKARDEVRDVLGKNHGKITYENLAELHYLDNIISESLRKNPPLFTMQKKCTMRYTLPPVEPHLKPTTIEPGMTIIIPVFGLHIDPEYFPEPETFDPERFNDRNKDSIKKFTYLPFGEGPRNCIGMRLAMMQVKIGIIRILENFTVRVSPKCQLPFKVDPTVFIFRPIGGIWLTFHKINKD